MKNIYQTVLDAAREKRRQMVRDGYSPSPRMVKLVEQHKRNVQIREAEELFRKRRLK